MRYLLKKIDCAISYKLILKVTKKFVSNDGNPSLQHVTGKKRINGVGMIEAGDVVAGGINGLRDMIARVRNNDSLGGYICRNDENVLEENDKNTSS